MSRLIFEGDTTDRFGRLFPKPIIENVKIYDDYIEADIALYFEIEEGVTASEFLESTGLDEIEFYTSLLPPKMLLCSEGYQPPEHNNIFGATRCKK